VNSARKGNAKELRTAELLAADGWLVGSRRHIGGAGDLLAVKRGERPRLIEVKATAEVPWRSTFGPLKRAELRDCAAAHGAVAEIAWWRPRARQPEWLDEAVWP
jgi:hypothetical protein